MTTLHHLPDWMRLGMLAVLYVGMIAVARRFPSGIRPYEIAYGMLRPWGLWQCCAMCGHTVIPAKGDLWAERYRVTCAACLRPPRAPQ